MIWILEHLTLLLALAALPTLMIILGAIAYMSRRKGDVGTVIHDGKRIR